MQGAATQAMPVRIVEERQLADEAPARRRAPSGRGPQARTPAVNLARSAFGGWESWLCCSLGEYRRGYAPHSRRASGPGGQQQNA